MVLCPIVIPFLRKLKFGQFVRDDGPQSHLKKAGTPTMGGLIILVSILLTSLLYIRRYSELIPVLFMTLGFGIIGFLDDYIKVVMKRSLGLKPLQKMFGQFIVTAVFVYYYYNVAHMTATIRIPFMNSFFTMPDWLFIIFVFIVVLGIRKRSQFYGWLRRSCFRRDSHCRNLFHDCGRCDRTGDDTDHRSCGRKPFGISLI